MCSQKLNDLKGFLRGHNLLADVSLTSVLAEHLRPRPQHGASPATSTAHREETPRERWEWGPRNPSSAAPGVSFFPTLPVVLLW